MGASRGYAGHVGRVGALAVALGIGAAATGWMPSAFAEAADSTGSSGSVGANTGSGSGDQSGKSSDS